MDWQALVVTNLGFFSLPADTPGRKTLAGVQHPEGGVGCFTRPLAFHPKIELAMNG